MRLLVVAQRLSASARAADKETSQHLLIILAHTNSMIIDRRFQYDLAQRFFIGFSCPMITVGNLIRLGKDRRSPFHVEEPCRPAKVEAQLQRIEQVKNGHVVSAKAQMLEAAPQ